MDTTVKVTAFSTTLILLGILACVTGGFIRQMHRYDQNWDAQQAHDAQQTRLRARDQGAVDDATEFLLANHNEDALTPRCVYRPTGVYTCVVSGCGFPRALTCRPRSAGQSNILASRCDWQRETP